ncbi:GNAT family N-acetyltransferase [Vibrio cholerae]|uniref:GNAT family N-acetyltransferase n=1 Tax=Vibrio cholerae TaxID=666 RepID=UPI00163BD682|nr:GNAT family N-acetyltransferase [Vibrio cholerae]
MVNYSKSICSSITVETQKSPDFAAIRTLLEPVSNLYPNFDSWFDFRFRRNFKSGERIVITAVYDSKIIGVALLKKTDVEHKICTLFVTKEARGQGTGSILLDKAIDVIHGNNIGISVAEERHSALQGLLVKRGFVLVSAEPNYYRNNVTEFFYELKTR